MSSESLDCCRLCLTSNDLISMFSGKERIIRDSLRKMIQETIHIEIEHNDSIPSVCFNCLVDASNFYFFKQNCLENQKKLKDLKDGFLQPKKRKLHSVPVADIQSPDVNSTQEVLNWLTAKQTRLLELQEIPKTSEDKDCQTFQDYIEASTQYDIVKSISKKTQTNEVERTHAKSTQTRDMNFRSSKVKTQNRYSQTSVKNNQVSDCYSQTEPKILSRQIFVNTYINPENFTQDCCTQTDLSEVINKNNNSRTQTKEMEKSKINDVKNCKLQTKPIIPEDNYTQTDVIDKGIQVDYIHNFGKNGFQGFKKGLQLSNLAKIMPDNCSKFFKIAEYHTLKDTLPNNDENNFLDKTSQTDLLQLTSVSTQCDLPNTFINKESFIFSTMLPTHSREVDSKLNTKICLKEEMISPSECLAVFTSPTMINTTSPNSSDLLQVKTNKSEMVKICKICGKSLYNKKETIMHNKIHLQCHLCKKKFRSLRTTEKHVNDCKLNLFKLEPFVDLTRVDYQQTDIKDKYPASFNVS